CRREKPHRRLGSRHDYRRRSQRHHHVARRPQVQIHQARQAPRQERRLRRAGVRTHPFAARRSHRNDHLRQRKRVRLPRRNRRRIGCQILLCEALSLVGTRPQRTHKRPRQAVLPKRHRLLYVVERRRPKGRGQTQLPPPQDTRLPNPKRSFPDGRLTRLLHFTVEWALAFNRCFSGPGTNAESHAIHHIGGYLYRRSGLRNYLLRFYGIDPKQISLQFVNRRMNLANLSSLRKAMQDLLGRMTRTRGAAADSKSWALARPVEGFPAHYEKVADALRAAGVEIRCAAGLKSVRKVQDEFETGTAHGTFFAKRVINTLPLKTVINLLGKPDAVEIASTKLCTLCCSLGLEGSE